MRRVVLYSVLCTLGFGLMGSAHAQIAIAADPNNAEMAIDVTLRDADLGEVLSALFNSTNGKYQLQVGNGVVGRIARLQFARYPFEKALDTVLGNEYSWTKANQPSGTILYRISAPSAPGTPAPKPVTGITPVFAPPTTSVPSVATDAGTLGKTATGATNAPVNAGFPILSLIGKTSGSSESKTSGSAASTEDKVTVVKLIGISHLDMDAICTALGGTTLALFPAQAGGIGTSGGGYSDPYGNTTGTNNQNLNNNNLNNQNLNNQNGGVQTNTTRQTNPLNRTTRQSTTGML